MNELLMRAVAEAAMFAGLSGADVIQEDAAVAFLEQLASTLKELSQGDREAFSAYTKTLAAQERARGGVERADFLAALTDNLGLVENAG